MNIVVVSATLSLALLTSHSASAQAVFDPGPRAGAAAAGGPLATLSPAQAEYFRGAQPFFSQRFSVAGTVTGAPGRGLGPRFNGDSCAGCHAFPAVGGSSPPVNPQPSMALAAGGANTLPPFITAEGPVRVARFIRKADGTPDGGVQNLFTVKGRGDAGACALTQPDFAAAIAANNVIFRIPTPIFGAGLVEETPDANLIAAVNAQSARFAALGVRTIFNHDPVDGTITRFGWKAQQKSLLAFAGEAENVEQGVTSDLRATERDESAGCRFGAAPDDAQPSAPRTGVSNGSAAMSAGFVNQAAFMRMTAPPARGPITADVMAGAALFASTGCDACHIPNQTTALSPLTGNVAVTYSPYSDFALHDMGGRLNDSVRQNEAAGPHWRTAPLWGLGQRLFFLHDGRARTLDAAILAHGGADSEGDRSARNFAALTAAQKRQIMLFLRSL